MENALGIGNYSSRDQQLELRPDMATLIRVLPGFSVDVSFKKIGDECKLVVNCDDASKVIR